ncbi:sodium-dependent transporter [Clostridium polynesiense]|uniref:sodium-dependent transporter n=1 Tax=Clostridium polynesiense TaxID=1325933 RepID=UPI00058AF235|nr:sodium-dependent transporter [Clostridium polynesiense]
MENKRGQWGSNLGFLMAAIGSAVGLGNLWGFPYKMGANGGFAFLLIYLMLVAFCGIIIMSIEMSLGRKTGKSPVLAFAQIGKQYKFIGWMGVLSAFVILSFYSTIGGYVIKYMVDFILNIFGNNSFKGVGGAEYFASVFSNPVTSITYHILFMVITIGIVMGGVNKGIENFNKIAMPSLLVMLLVVIVRSVTLPGSVDGIKFMFSFSGAEFNFFKAVRAAGGQMLFSLSLGMGCLITYGSYLSKKENIVKNAFIIPIADTVFALMAGFAILPAVFAKGLDPASGPSLLFQTLHEVFNSMGYIGLILGFIFYMLALFAALTSSVSLLEVACAHFIDTRLEMGKSGNRRMVTAIVGTAVIIFGIPVALDALGSSGMYQPLGLCWLDFYDFLSEGIMMPLAAVFMSLLMGWKIGLGYMENEITLEGNKFIGKSFFAICIKYITPLLMSFVLISLALSFFNR